MILNPPSLNLSKIAGVEIKDYPKACPCCGEAFESYTKRKKAITYDNLKNPMEHTLKYACGSTWTALWMSPTYLTYACKSRRIENLIPKFEGDISFDIEV